MKGPVPEIGDRIARLAHDATNGLARVGSVLALLADRTGDDEAAHLEREGEHCLAEAVSALREIVDLVRGGTTTADLRERITAVVPQLAADLATDPLPVRLSSAEREILDGVLSEIARAERPHRARASIERGDGRIRLHVDSDAPAFDDAERERRLAPNRLRNPAGLGGGISLGLGAAVLRRLGGDLRLGSGPGGTRRYSVDLPDGGPRRAGPPPRGPRSILVVEDEPGVAQSIRLLLESLGHRAVLATSVGEARTRLADGGIDALVVDLRLGTGSGSDLIDHVERRHPDLLGSLVISTGAPGSVPPSLSRFPLLAKPFGREALCALFGEA